MIRNKNRIVIVLWLLATIGQTPRLANPKSQNGMDDKKSNPITSHTSTQLIDHDRLINEQTDHLKLLTFLYTNSLGRGICHLLNRRSINKLCSWYQNSRLSVHKIAPFIKKYGINLDDFEQPVNGYKSFNDFFIRKLKPGRRSIDPHFHAIIAPADSKVLVISTITPQTTFFVKSRPFNLATFLHDEQLATAYTNGTMFIFRLAPYDYHWFHFPADGIPEAPIIIAGRFDSVNPLVYKAGYQPLLSNERHIIKIQTKVFDTILMVAVGAMLVGKIVETYNHGQPVTKGDEAGYFAFGGSTIVLIFKPGIIKPKTTFIENSVKNFETVVKMGEAVTE